MASWPQVIDAGRHFDPTLADVPAVLAQMDGVIAPDGIPLHLAGGLGLPGIALLQPDCPWYWFAPDGVSHWYPTIETLQTGGLDRPAERLERLSGPVRRFLDRLAGAPAGLRGRTP